MTTFIIILVVLLIISIAINYYLFTKSSDKSGELFKKEIQIKSLLINYNKSSKKIKSVHKTLDALNKSNFKTQSDYLKLLDSL